MFRRLDNGREGHLYRWLLGVLLGLGSGLAAVAALTPGSLVVERIGDGSAPLTNSATPVFLDVFNPDGTSAAPSIALPKAAPRPTSAPFNLMDSGNATSDGFLTRSADGLWLQMPGYNGIPGDTSIVSSTNTRTIGVVNGAGAVDTSRSLAMFSGNNFRSVVSVDGTAFWAAGTSSSQGVVYVNGGSVNVLEHGQHALCQHFQQPALLFDWEGHYRHLLAGQRVADFRHSLRHQHHRGGREQPQPLCVPNQPGSWRGVCRR